MFKKLRIKIIIVIISVFAILFASILVSIYIASYQKSISDTNFKLRFISKHNRVKRLSTKNSNSKKYKKNNFDSSRYYIVQFGKNHNILHIFNESNSGMTDKELGKLATNLLKKNIRNGSVKNLMYYVNKNNRNNETIVAFSNNSLQTSYLDTLFYNILIFGCIGLLLLFTISIWLSYWLVKPVEDAFQKQKKFISDASHELKTPVAVISANADVLQREIGESKWLNYINSETIRINSLITELLDLAKIDSSEEKRLFKKINLSETVLSIVLPFESIAYEKQITLKEQINENIYILGDSTRLGQLTSILLDNAFNHTQEGGYINVQLKQHRNRKILTVSNTGKAIPPAERELIFERFYRVDESRTREKGNYGLGLSIAKSIAKNHDGKIIVTCKNNWTIFKVTL